MLKRLCWLMLWMFTVCAHASVAPGDDALDAELLLTHVGPDRWQADFALAEPVERINLDLSGGPYRQHAWRVLTPQAALVERAGQESLDAGGRQFAAVSIGVIPYLPTMAKSYSAFERFSDGGNALYLGYFQGTAVQGTRKRPLRLTLRLRGLGSETVLGPPERPGTTPAYAYFGPAAPTTLGAVDLIVDPQTPAHVARTLEQTLATLGKYYAQALGRPLRHRPLVMLTVNGFEQPGLMSKGGAVGGQMVLQLGGRALLEDTAGLRQRFASLVAHEMAHLWQSNIERGGIGEDDAWIHEGGAEALSLAALRNSGLLSATEADAFATRWQADCTRHGGSVDSPGGMYACGYRRFTDTGIDIFALWTQLMARSEATGEVYSAAMFQALSAPATALTPR